VLPVAEGGEAVEASSTIDFPIFLSLILKTTSVKRATDHRRHARRPAAEVKRADAGPLHFENGIDLPAWP
jgi:hypothetical protein